MERAVAGVAAAAVALLRAWDEVPAVVRLELRTVTPGLVPALDRWVAAEVSLLAARQADERAVRATGEKLQAALAGLVDLKARAHSIAAVHEGMGR